MEALKNEPSKFFWYKTEYATDVGFLQFDAVLRELTCITCFYQCYGQNKMMKHIMYKHSTLYQKIMSKKLEQTPEEEPPAVNVEVELPVKIPETKPLETFESKKEKTPKISAPCSPKENPGYHCRDIVLGELICEECQYTTFQRSVMIKHIAKKHHKSSLKEDLENPTIETDANLTSNKGT